MYRNRGRIALGELAVPVGIVGIWRGEEARGVELRDLLCGQGPAESAQILAELLLVARADEHARASRGVSLRYGDEWLARGFALSEDLPLIAEEFLPREKDTAAGAVDDARPDRWGERVIRLLDKPPRLSLLEYLYFAGDDRFGALGISMSSDHYVPRRTGALPRLAAAGVSARDVDSYAEQIDRPFLHQQRKEFAPGRLGG